MKVSGPTPFRKSNYGISKFSIFFFDVEYPFGNFGSRKMVEKWQLSGVFGRFRGEKSPFQFVTQCYIWAFSG